MKSSIYEIADVNLRALNHQAFYQLIKDSYDSLYSYLAEHPDDQLQAQMTGLPERLLSYQASYQKVKKSPIVAELATAAKEQNKAFSGLWAYLKAHSYTKNAEKQVAYQTLYPLLSTYKTASRQSYEKDIARYDQLLKRLAQPTYQEAVTKLGLDEQVQELTRSQEQVTVCYKKRLQELSERENNQSQTYREHLFKQYQVLMDYVTVVAYIQSEDGKSRTELTKLKDQLNTIRKRYKKRRNQKAIDDFTEKNLDEVVSNPLTTSLRD